jgi:2-dehydropantoate 2-reductase
MGKRIAIIGAGALGGYVGGTLAHHGLDVTLIDMWPEHIEAIRSRGLELDGLTPDEQFTVTEAKTMHLTEVQSLPRGSIDIAMVAVKSYDTEWATMLIWPYLAPGGYVVSLQNCLNEERIAALVGWGRTVGVIASLISVDLHEAGRVRRTMPKGGAQHTVFRVGEPHGRITPRVEELREMFSLIDSAKTTANLWGERWSKLVQNGMGNGVTALTGLSSSGCLANETIRRFQIQLAGEGVRVGQALGFPLEKIRGVEPEQMARAAEGDAGARAAVDAILTPKAGGNPRADIQRPSMAQDILKGRRTEIEMMNGVIAAKGAEIGIPAPSHEKLTALVLRLERGEIRPSPAHLGASPG